MVCDRPGGNGSPNSAEVILPTLSLFGGPVLPLYEYECTVCKHRFELLQKFSDEPAKVCVRCGAPVQRLLSSPAIHFKGTGWYVTDYGKSGSTAESKKSKDDSGDKAPAASESATIKEPAASSKEAPKT